MDSGFASDPDASPDLQAILRYATFCFGVFVARYADLNRCSIDTAAGRIDSGISVAQDVAYPSYRYLGIPESSTRALVDLNGDGIADVPALAAVSTYLLRNVYHAVFAAHDVFDNDGDPLTVSQFVRKHRSLFKGTRVWALQLL